MQAQLPQLPGRLRAVLALWVQGTLRGRNGCQDAVTLALAQGLTGRRNPHPLRRRQRELRYDDADRIDSWGPDQELEVEGCCAPRLQWVRSGWVPTDGRELAQEPRVLAVDPRPEGPRKQDDLVALVISGVYRQHAIPVAWHIVRAQAKEPWIEHFCRLLRQLAPAVPATVPVPGLCDQGLGSRDLWAQIVALGGHPCLRYPPPVTFQPEGQTPRVPVRSLITGPGGLGVGTGQAFRDAPRDATLIVLHAYGQRQPWVLLTDTPVAQTEPTLYACRNWIEQGFRGLKTVGDPLGGKWHKTRRLDPGALWARGGRHWLVLAMATWLAVAYGTRREDAEARHRAPGRLRRPPAELTAAQQDALPPRRHSRLQQGVALLRRLLQRGYLWACVWLRPTPGPDFRTQRVPGRRRLDPGGTCIYPRCRRGTRIALLHRSLHTPAASVLRTPRPAPPAVPPPRGLSARTRPLTVARAGPDPATHGGAHRSGFLLRSPPRKYPCKPPPSGPGWPTPRWHCLLWWTCRRAGNGKNHRCRVHPVTWASGSGAGPSDLGPGDLQQLIHAEPMGPETLLGCAYGS